MTSPRDLVDACELIRRIYLVRGHRVMLDSDLAAMYEVETKALNRAVKRNAGRFPQDFAFRLTGPEAESLRCQIGTSKEGRGGRRYLPLVFTEQGVAMLSGVLTSERAVKVNVAIMRAFVRLRRMVDSQRGLARKLRQLEGKYDAQFRIVFDAIRDLMKAEEEPRPQIGFRPGL